MIDSKASISTKFTEWMPANTWDCIIKTSQCLHILPIFSVLGISFMWELSVLSMNY